MFESLPVIASETILYVLHLVDQRTLCAQFSLETHGHLFLMDLFFSFPLSFFFPLAVALKSICNKVRVAKISLFDFQ